MQVDKNNDFTYTLKAGLIAEGILTKNTEQLQVSNILRSLNLPLTFDRTTFPVNKDDVFTFPVTY